MIATVLLVAGEPVLAQQADAALLAKVDSGFWWSPDEGGRGYALQAEQDALFFVAYYYEPAGAATWSSSLLKQDAATPARFDGVLNRTAGGTPMGGAYRPVTTTAPVGNVSLTFSGPSTATITWPDGSTTPIRRFQVASGSLAAPVVAGLPQGGVFWNAAQPGVGFAIDVQGTNFILGAYAYRADGTPLWCIASGRLTDQGFYTWPLVEFRDGMTIGGTGPVKPATPVSSSVCSSLQIASAGNPDQFVVSFGTGAAIPLTRFTGFSGRPNFLGLIHAISTSPNSATLSWLPAQDAVTPPDQISYDIFDVPEDGNLASATLRATVTGGMGTTFTGLIAGRTYRLVARARNGRGLSSISSRITTISTAAAPLVTVPQARDAALYGLQAGTVAGDVITAPAGSAIPSEGTILYGTVGGGPILARVDAVT